MFGVNSYEVIMLFGILIAFVIPLALLVWALVDLLKNPYLRDVDRLIWALVIIFVGVIGPILYLTIGRNIPPPGSRRDT